MNVPGPLGQQREISSTIYQGFCMRPYFGHISLFDMRNQRLLGGYHASLYVLKWCVVYRRCGNIIRISWHSRVDLVKFDLTRLYPHQDAFGFPMLTPLWSCRKTRRSSQATQYRTFFIVLPLLSLVNLLDPSINVSYRLFR